MKKKLETGFSVPENYFSELTQKIEAATAVERLKSLTQTDGFDVPTDYFEQLELRLTAQTNDVGQTAKIKKLWSTGLVRYTAAACFALIAGLAWYINEPSTPIANVHYADIASDQVLFDIDEDVIIEHIEASALQENQISKHDAALESYILTNYSSSEITNEY